ncbi:glycogen-debranching protein [Saccharopolyspora erythraea]|uniref:glycogen debranching protein n=1 Tax=Saccharopolyspora erythraea TaxID=1836 RepID=UPI001BAB837C|nr:isoamylase [Saccharopolyspora erythraea]QUH02170.1 glycogen-debranching protein [Saccharopolyspora erythraea]
MTTTNGFAVRPGRTAPLGAVAVDDGVNFAVVSRTAERVWLVLLSPRDGTEIATIPFPGEYRFGAVWAMTVVGLPAEVDYAYRVDGPDGTGNRFAPDALLLDPHGTAVAGGEIWGRARTYRSRVLVDDFDWGADRKPRIPPEDLVIYEAHVRGFTRHPSSGTRVPGTYAGFRDKIPHLARLGVNCVELMPVFEFDDTDNSAGEGLVNYWGYDPVSFLAPKAAYAADPQAPARELKELVRDLHAHGIEVVLDVVFNHTAEGDHRGPTLSWRGVDNATYYLLGPGGEDCNYSGTGNTVNANDPVVRSYVVDCLRYWATEYRVDGFRFDLTSALTRGGDGHALENPPLLEQIAHDPVLADCRLIAEPWDAAGLYQVGRFPHHQRWMEWNGRYRDAVRRFLVGRPDSAGELATRLVGSPDLYGERGTTASVNFVTCHDGFTLADWAAFDHKHNEANGEDGQDGPGDEASWNCGVEGRTDDEGVLRLRERQVRNALALLLLSHGVPMLLGGDEFGRTQLGNSNAYCHDGSLTWLDWDMADRNAGLVEFVRRCLAFRRAHPVLRRTAHPSGEADEGAAYPPVSWHGRRPGDPDWSTASGLLVALLHQEVPGDTVLVIANAHAEAEEIALPEVPPGTGWHRFLDTCREPAATPIGSEEQLPDQARIVVAAHSVVVLVAGEEAGG